MRELKNTSFPAGTVGIPAALTPRYWEFIDALDALEVPEGTVVNRVSSCDITANCNRLIAEMSGECLLFLDDDQLFSPDILMRLLAHAYGSSGQAIDIVAPLNVIKMPPFPPMLFHTTLSS